jgi:hypothetical protein
MNVRRKDAVGDKPVQATTSKNSLHQFEKIGKRKKSRENAINSGTPIDIRMVLPCHIRTKA